MVERRVELDEELCTGCGLCAAVCPNDAITMVEKKHKVFMMEDV
jgi:formate hydrogenlyase subunit 6/NADH:ubiquinone oxidoreductase subunit I